VVNARPAPTSDTTNKPQPQQVCHRCGTVLLVGQQIGLVNDDWVHVACLLNRQPMIGPHSGA
jgi:hypothetical protein